MIVTGTITKKHAAYYKLFYIVSYFIQINYRRKEIYSYSLNFLMPKILTTLNNYALESSWDFWENKNAWKKDQLIKVKIAKLQGWWVTIP